MQVDKIKIGKSYPYFCRTNPRECGEPFRGKVVAIKPTKKGPYIALEDKVRGVTVSVRASQVGV